MARLVKNFIGGIASKVTGTYEEIDEEESVSGEVVVEEEENEKEDSKEESNEENGLMMKVGSSEEPEKVSFTTSEEDEQDGEINEQDDFWNEQAMPGKPPSKHGQLSKWTNYLLGWQERYVVVRDGVLSYYKSEFDVQIGCRGSISLHKVRVLVSVFITVVVKN